MRAASWLSAAVLCALLAWPHPAEAKRKDACRGADIVFLIDVSYSFGSANAQRNAFADGIGAFLDQIETHHRIGLVRFGTKPTRTVAMSAYDQLTRNEIVRQIKLFDFKEPWTDVYTGLEDAFVLASADPKRRGVVVVISDGAISLGDPTKPWSKRDHQPTIDANVESIRGLYQRVKDAGVQFYTVAFDSKNTNEALMREVAENTGGMTAFGDVNNLPDIMGKFAAEMCDRDPQKAAPAPVAQPTPPPAQPTPPPAQPVTPTPPTPTVAPAPVVPTPPIPMWLGVVGMGAGAAATGLIVASSVKRRRRRRFGSAGAAAATGGAAAGAFSAAGVAVDAKKKRAAADPAAAAFFTAKAEGTVTMAAIEDPQPTRKKLVPKAKHGAPVPERGHDLPAGVTGARPAIRSPGRGPEVAIDSGEIRGERAKGPPPKPTAPPPRKRVHYVHLLGYRRNGDLIKELVFRRSGDVHAVVATRAGALLDLPDDMSHVVGALKLTVEKDGTRIVTVEEVPPGGFRDLDTGESLGYNARLTNNVRFEWVKEPRGRWCEVIFK